MFHLPFHSQPQKMIFEDSDDYYNNDLATCESPPYSYPPIEQMRVISQFIPDQLLYLSDSIHQHQKEYPLSLPIKFQSRVDHTRKIINENIYDCVSTRYRLTQLDGDRQQILTWINELPFDSKWLLEFWANIHKKDIITECFSFCIHKPCLLDPSHTLETLFFAIQERIINNNKEEPSWNYNGDETGILIQCGNDSTFLLFLDKNNNLIQDSEDVSITGYTYAVNYPMAEQIHNVHYQDVCNRIILSHIHSGGGGEMLNK